MGNYALNICWKFCNKTTIACDPIDQAHENMWEVVHQNKITLTAHKKLCGNFCNKATITCNLIHYSLHMGSYVGSFVAK